MKLTKLSSIFRTHFSWKKSNSDFFVQFVLGLIQVRSINLSRIAQTLGYNVTASAYERLRRFIRETTFSCSHLACYVAKTLELSKEDKWRLVFDRTNWKFGKKHINILFISVCRQRVSVPIFFVFLRDKKSGNSNQEDRIKLIKKFIKTFGKECVGVILGDREFIGVIWLKYLIKERLPFCFRLKEGWQKVSLPCGRSVEVKKCFKGLKRGQIRSLGLRQLGEGKSAVKCYIKGMRSKKGDWIILAHSECIDNPLELYRERWQIETMFRMMKKGGFNMEDTHVTDPNRLECLIGVLTIASAICYKSGEIAVTERPPKPKKNGCWPKTIFRYGLDKLIETMHQRNLQPIKFKRLMDQVTAPFRRLKSVFVW